MSEPSSSAQKSTKPRQRAVQQRAEDTKDHLITAAIELFSALGFDGVSVRTIETHADVKRGLVAYHFGTKEDLWFAAVGRLFTNLAEQMSGVEEATKHLDMEARFRAATHAFVEFSAKFPELNRIMVQEAKMQSWRSDHIIDVLVRPLVDWMQRMAGREIDVHTHYIILGATTFVFDVEYECEKLFGLSPRTEGFAKTHADHVVDMILGKGTPFIEQP